MERQNLVSVVSQSAQSRHHHSNQVIRTPDDLINFVSIRSVAASPFQRDVLERHGGILKSLNPLSRGITIPTRLRPYQQLVNWRLNPLSRGITIPTTGSGGHCRQYPFCLNPLSRGITIPTKGAEMFFPQFGVSIRSVAASPFQRVGLYRPQIKRAVWSQSAQSRHHHSNGLSTIWESSFSKQVSIRSVAASPFQRRGRSFVCVRCFWSQSAQSRHHHSNV